MYYSGQLDFFGRQLRKWTFLFHSVTNGDFVNPFACIIEESTRFSRMPTATAPTAKKIASRKPRARKAAAKKPTVSKVTVTTFKSGKAVSKVTTLKRPSTARLISPSRYVQDIQTRWAIHQYEIQELVRDLRKGFDLVTPYHAQLVKQVKAWTV